MYNTIELLADNYYVYALCDGYEVIKYVRAHGTRLAIRNPYIWHTRVHKEPLSNSTVGYVPTWATTIRVETIVLICYVNKPREGSRHFKTMTRC